MGRLKKLGRSEHSLHREVFRPWGSYDSLENGQRFQVKRLCVKPGAQLSLQLHHHRAEHWVVVRARLASRVAMRRSCSKKTSPPTFPSAFVIASRTPGRFRCT